MINYKSLAIFVFWFVSSYLTYVEGGRELKHLYFLQKLRVEGWPLSWKSRKSQGKWKTLKWSGKTHGIWGKEESQGILIVSPNIDVYHSSVSTWWFQYQLDDFSFCQNAICRSSWKIFWGQGEVRENESQKKLSALFDVTVHCFIQIPKPVNFNWYLTWWLPLLESRVTVVFWATWFWPIWIFYQICAIRIIFVVLCMNCIFTLPLHSRSLCLSIRIFERSHC